MDQPSSLHRTRTKPEVDWRMFLRSLAEEVDSLAGSGERDDMLRGVGRRMARMLPLSPVTSLDALEMEINDALDGIGWGEVRLSLNEAERTLELAHAGMPRIGSLGAPPGQWLSALLEGLYDGWLGQQPGHKPTLGTRRVAKLEPGVVTLSYARR